MQMEDILYQKDLYQPIDGKKPADMEQAKWDVLDHKALGTVRLCLALSCVEHGQRKDYIRFVQSPRKDVRKKPSAVNKSAEKLEWTCRGSKQFFRICKEDKLEDVVALIGLGSEAVSKKSIGESWIIDSGASFHATPCMDVLQNYVQGNFGKVYLGDDEACNIVGKGDVQITQTDRTILKLKDVRHVPSITRNLISVGQLSEGGVVPSFTSDAWKMSKGALILARGKKEGTLYVSSGTYSSITMVASGIDCTTWHRRLGHMSEKGDEKEGQLYKGGKDSKNGEVGACSYRHVGSIKGMKLKCLKSDNGDEYCSSEFEDYCAANGIRRLKTVPKKPRQNGVAERMSRTILERARSMRLHAGYLSNSWAEAVNTAVYLINRGPSVPFELWIARREFGQARRLGNWFNYQGEVCTAWIKEESDGANGTRWELSAGFKLASIGSQVDSALFESAAVSWVSRLQKIVTISTTEAEYVAATEACKEMVWLRSFMKELGMEQDNSKLFSDSQSAIHLAKNAAFHSRTKHIDIKCHFIRSLLEDGQFTFEKINTRDNPADMFTKVVTVEKLKSCSTSVGLSA
ncbi:hypothetical protein Acr_00g0103530 [Actinidia rufa]|uniref:Integrase catalytic domain-containing protein n=1 Tax=Actinidia rufa TaxID=165716 RepID=A0A7J0E0Y9_9ERIC|nr:hypothetical protein Acr_00g0103530 [Actinidia rufa]